MADIPRAAPRLPATRLPDRRGASTVDPQNVALFGRLAGDWWAPDGAARLLHRVNPVRLSFLRAAAVSAFGRDPRALRALEGLDALDVGCGGGLVAEPLARMGAAVVGIDAAPAAVAAARAHAQGAGLRIDYREGTAEALAERMPESFDLVTAFEVIEHVADVGLFLRSLHRLLKPEGLLVFSTPSRTRLSRAVMITAAERILRILPRGTHDWTQFLTPQELEGHLAAAGFTGAAMRGISWRPGRGFHLSDDMSVSIIGSARRAGPADAAGEGERVHGPSAG